MLEFFHCGYKKLRIGVEFFHPYPGKVKDENMWASLEHLGLQGDTQGPWAPDSHSALYLISFEVCVFAASCPLLYKYQRHHWTSKTTSFGLPACNPQRQPEERVSFSRICDPSPICGKDYSKEKNNLTIRIFSHL